MGVLLLRPAIVLYYDYLFYFYENSDFFVFKMKFSNLRIVNT